MNSNRRVIGSIVKKSGNRGGGSEKMKKNTERAEETERKAEESSRGRAVLVIFYPKTAPSLRRAILLICKGASEKWGGKE